MSDTSELVRRLELASVGNAAINRKSASDLLSEAADTITSLTLQVERLTEGINNILAHRYGDWTGIARALLTPEGDVGL